VVAVLPILGESTTPCPWESVDPPRVEAGVSVGRYRGGFDGRVARSSPGAHPQARPLADGQLQPRWTRANGWRVPNVRKIQKCWFCIANGPVPV
jgi:hypothetical protein